MKPQPMHEIIERPKVDPVTGWQIPGRSFEWDDDDATGQIWKCHHPVGSRIWVKETWADVRLLGLDDDLFPRKAAYRADCMSSESLDIAKEYGVKWKPSIFMPRWASRIDLEVTAVKVERLKDITDFDAFQEGAESQPGNITGPYCSSHIEGFKQLWESINGEGSWDLNPWVWVYTFRRVKP